MCGGMQGFMSWPSPEATASSILHLYTLYTFYTANPITNH